MPRYCESDAYYTCGYDYGYAWTGSLRLKEGIVKLFKTLSFSDFAHNKFTWLFTENRPRFFRTVMPTNSNNCSRSMHYIFHLIANSTSNATERFQRSFMGIQTRLALTTHRSTLVCIPFLRPLLYFQLTYEYRHLVAPCYTISTKRSYHVRHEISG